MKLNLIQKGWIAVAMMPGLVFASATQAAPQANANQKQIEAIVHDYLLNNPEILIEVSQKLQQKRQTEVAEKSQAAILANVKEVFPASAATQVGNAKANVTLVEFFDYQCMHCKHMAPVMDGILQKNNNVRVIYKELPIFGKSSEDASKAALAAAKQGKYKEMHAALLATKGHITAEYINNTAKKIGLNIDQFKKDSASDEIKKQLDANRDLAKKLNLMGTPAFIVGATPSGQFKAGSKPFFVPGAASEEALLDMIKKSAAAS